MKYLFFMLLPFLMLACQGNDASSSENRKRPKPTISVRTAPVQTKALDLSIEAMGQITSTAQAKPAFKIGGVVTKMYVDKGDAVKVGQLLARLDLTEIAAQVLQAKESVKKSKRDLERAENLYADSVATLENVQDAQTGLAVASEQLRIAEFNQNYAEIRSPIRGKVLEKLTNVGEIVGPGMPAYVILGNTKKDWVVRVGLSDRDWARVHKGDRAVVRFDAYPGKAFEARVSKLADTGNPGSGTFDVEMVFINPMPRLAAGLLATVSIHPRAVNDLVVIPLDALVETNRTEGNVFTIKDNKAQLRPIKIAFLHNDQVVVSSGLEEVDFVVTDGAPYLYEGAVVDIFQ